MLLPLPTVPRVLIHDCINPALLYLPAKMRDLRAVVQLATTAAQESGLTTRTQVGGPARGLWQFEKMGGCHEVMTNPATQDLAQGLCRTFNVPFDLDAVFAALSTNDEFAACFARLNYWRSPLALPSLGDASQAWRLYKTVWAPGKPHPDKWPALYKAALEAATKG